MRKEEILNSGLLELYVIGGCTPYEEKVVETALDEFKDLRQELYEIEKTLRQYSQIHSISPGTHVKKEILNKLKGSDQKIKYSSAATPKWHFPFMIIFGLISLGLSFSFFNSNKNKKQLEQQYADQVIQCDSLRAENERNLELISALTANDVEVIFASATEKYPATKMYIHTSKSSKKNILQLTSLPPINQNQSYQLWSLKDGVDPIPMDVFETQSGNIIEVGFEENSNSYAITIEELGGKSTPTLENLVGVFTLGS